MLEIHKEENGIAILIAEMDDEHLLKTIKMICRKIDILAEIINIDNSAINNPIAKALMPIPTTANIEKQAKDKIQELDETIQPYICEACLRGINITEVLQKTYQRNKALPSRSKQITQLFNQSIKGYEEV